MKTITLYVRTILTLTFLALLVNYAAAAKTPPAKIDFSGKWLLNISKSNFGDNPSYVVPKQIVIVAKETEFELTFQTIGTTDTDSTFNEKDLLGGVSFQKQSSDQRKVKYVVSLTDDGNTLNRDYSVSYSGKPEQEQYHTIEIWKLSADGKTLNMIKHVKLDSGDEYEVEAVYDKQ